MKVIIVGAGAVGSHLAERLAGSGQDVVVIEADPARAEELQQDVDCLVVVGNGASQETLEEAGAKGADLMIAVTNSDAANILACYTASQFDIPSRIARVEEPELVAGAKSLGVDVVIDPVDALAKELSTLMRRGGLTELIEFADGRLVLIGGRIGPDAPVAGGTLADLRERVSGWDWLVVAIVRDGKTLIARGSSQLQEGDHVLLMAKTGRTREAFDLLGIEEHPTRKAIVLGATRLAQLVAQELSADGVHVTLIDEDAERCQIVAEAAPKVVCVNADPTDPKVLRLEGVEHADALLALTGWEEVNLLGCLVGKALGAATTVSRFHRFDLIHLLPGVGIDVGVSSRLAAANAILRYVRRGRISSVVTFQDSDAEAIEFEVGPGSPAAGKSLRELHLDHGIIVGGVLRRGEAFVPRGDTVIEVGDTLIVIALPEAIPEVERLAG